MIEMCIKERIFTHGGMIIMRTNVELDDTLVKQALQVSRLKTKKEVIHEALKHYVASLKRKQLLTLRGDNTWEGDNYLTFMQP